MRLRILFPAGLILVLVAACSTHSAADPRPEFLWAYGNPTEAITTIFILNISTNLFWFSAVLLATCLIFGKGLGRPQDKPTLFLGNTIVVGLVVTGLGALIDYTLLLAEYPFGFVLYYDPANWFVAVVLIFASVYGASMLFLRLSPTASLMPAAVIAGLNPIWWAMTPDAPFIMIAATVAVSLVMIPITFLLLWRWHSRRFSNLTRETPTRTE